MLVLVMYVMIREGKSEEWKAADLRKQVYRNSNDDRIRDLNELHLFTARLCVCYHTARICREETYVYVHLRSRFLIAVCS